MWRGLLYVYTCFSRHKLKCMHKLGETEWQCCECAGSQPDCAHGCASQVSERSVKAMLFNGQG